MADLDKLADQLSQLTLREIIQLTRTIINRAAPPRPAAAEATTRSVVIQNPGGGKIQVIKVIRELTGLGLADAKKMVDRSPQLLHAGLPPAEAEQWARKLREAGATVQVS